MKRVALGCAVLALVASVIFAVADVWVLARELAAVALILGGWLFAWEMIAAGTRIDGVGEPPVGGRHE